MVRTVAPVAALMLVAACGERAELNLRHKDEMATLNGLPAVASVPISSDEDGQVVQTALVPLFWEFVQSEVRQQGVLNNAPTTVDQSPIHEVAAVPVTMPDGTLAMHKLRQAQVTQGVAGTGAPNTVVGFGAVKDIAGAALIGGGAAAAGHFIGNRDGDGGPLAISSSGSSVHSSK